MEESQLMKTRADEGYRLLAAKYVRKQARQLAEQLDGIRQSTDIEFIHRARVASRRLRAAMRMFDECFDAGQWKQWRKHIRRVTTGLGDARDRDVQIEFLCGVLAGVQEKARCAGIARLLAKLQQRRDRLQGEVVKAVDRVEACGVLQEMQAATKSAVTDGKAKEASVQSPVSYAQTRRHILHNLQQMMQYGDSLDDPEDQQRHHAMRIAAKRLRYTMEISKAVYGGQLDEPVAVIKRLQTLLGDVHDCDVWVEQLDAFADKQRKRILKLYGHAEPFARLQVGIDYLQQERREHHRQVFRELVDYWQQLNEQKHWEQLAAMVESASEASDEAQNAP